MGKFIDITGQKYGRYTVLERAENKIDKDGHVHAQFVCRCDCGNIRLVPAKDLKSGNTKSCGCLRNEKTVLRNKETKVTHGKRGTRLYHIWRGMKDRCYNSNLVYYKNYGGRGIKICEQWKSDFSSFYDWAISSGYRDDLTIDRIDVNGNYCPENCRWATEKEQLRNTRVNRYITYRGETKSAVEWSEIVGILPCTIISRLKRGWDVEKTFNQPVDERKATRKRVI